jgi:cyclin-dependent kinase 8/11
MDRKSFYIPELTIKSLMWQLLNGLHYLHCNWVVHRDLKVRNEP